MNGQSFSILIALVLVVPLFVTGNIGFMYSGFWFIGVGMICDAIEGIKNEQSI